MNILHICPRDPSDVATLPNPKMSRKQSEVCLSNTVENDFFGFPKVKWLQWLHMTGDVDKSVRCSCQIFSGFYVPKIIKIG